MKISTHRVPLVALAVAASFSASAPAWAQIAGSTTTVETVVAESTQLALGWSVKKTLLGKFIYNDAGLKVGKVEDLIISPDRNVSYVIVGAGGFIGIGRHDVAIAVTQIQDRSGKLVMPGATKEMIKSMPAFAYVDESAKREQLIAAADRDIAKGKARVGELEKKAGVAASDAKAGIAVQVAALQADVKSTEARLGELKQATVARWREFEAGGSTATAHLRKSIESATG